MPTLSFVMIVETVNMCHLTFSVGDLAVKGTVQLCFLGSSLQSRFFWAHYYLKMQANQPCILHYAKIDEKKVFLFACDVAGN